ncbi:MAG: hypothetical protein ABL966_03525 [Acidimicrobiales bacterium]
MHRLRRTTHLVVLALGLVVATAGPAGADAAGPSDFRSEVTGIVPAAEGVHAEIRGGDAFLELVVDDGHTVIVEGYQGEPYLRFTPGGTVERNRLSTATYLNDDRRGGGVTIPADVQAADADTPPEWETVADGGTYAWHDHRVHWMEDASPNVERGNRVEGAYDPWKVPLVVDGAPVEVQGTLTFEASVSPLPYVGLALIVAGLLAFYGRGQLPLAAGLLAVVSLLALVVGLADFRSTPAGGGNPLLWGLAGAALVTAVGALVLARRSAGVVLALASVAALSGWALLRIQALLKPVLPTALPFALDRTTIALALGVSLAAAYLAVTSGVLALPDLDDD